MGGFLLFYASLETANALTQPRIAAVCCDVAAECAHAALGSVRQHQAANMQLFQMWVEAGQHIFVVQARDASHMVSSRMKHETFWYKYVF
jgi:peptidyl-tRNA hydrolase